MTSRLAIRLSLVILTLVSLFHLSILLRLIPYEITWGGKLKNDSEMYVFEVLSLAVNGLLIFALLVKGRFIGNHLPEKVVSFILWIYFLLFLLNTVGNLLAETFLEKSFSIITLSLAALLWIILRSARSQK